LTAARLGVKAAPRGASPELRLPDRAHPTSAGRDQCRPAPGARAASPPEPEAQTAGDAGVPASCRGESADEARAPFVGMRDESCEPLAMTGTVVLASAPECSASEHIHPEPQRPQARARAQRRVSSSEDEDVRAAQPLPAALHAGARTALAALADGARDGETTRFVVTAAGLGRLGFVARREGSTLRVVLEVERSLVTMSETLRADLASSLGAVHPDVQVAIAIRGTDGHAVGESTDAAVASSGSPRR